MMNKQWEKKYLKLDNHFLKLIQKNIENGSGFSAFQTILSKNMNLRIINLILDSRGTFNPKRYRYLDIDEYKLNRMALQQSLSGKGMIEIERQQGKIETGSGMYPFNYIFNRNQQNGLLSEGTGNIMLQNWEDFSAKNHVWDK